MAAERKKSTSQGRKQAAKKGSSSGRKSSGRNDRKDSNGTDILTIVVVVLAVVLVVFLLINYNKEKGNGENENGNLTAAPTGGPLATVTDLPGDITPTAQPAKQPTGTPPAGTTPAARPTAEAKNTPKPTEPPVLLSVEEAENIVRNRIGNPEYTVELLDDHLMIDGEEYYSFCVNDENGKTMEPLLIVEKKEGQLFCYDFSGVVSRFSKFPLDKTETGSSGTDVISEEQAKKVLLGYSGKALGLAMEVSEYEMEVNSWKTVADGKECYDIDLFATTGGRRNFCGTFYVALDGSAVYSRNDETGEVTKR